MFSALGLPSLSLFAYTTSDPTKGFIWHKWTFHLEYDMASVTLHVVGGLIEVSHARYVVLAGLAYHVSTVTNDNSSVPEGIPMDTVSLQDWGYNDHVVLLGQLRGEADMV